VNLIGNGMLALLRNPEQLRLLREQPTLIGTAVEELLRWDSPVQVDGRSVLEESALPDGTTLPVGATVITLLGSANRDPERFAEPETFDVGRTDNVPLSFAWGIHHCLGASLARAEGQVAFADLLERYRRIELLDDPPRWRRTLTLRGLDGLAVRLTR
jgi:cytochrome P450